MKASLWYDAGKLALWSGLDLRSAAIRCALMTDAYQPGRTLHRTYDDLDHEAEGPGYDPGGVLLSGQRLSMRKGLCCFHADDVVLPRCSVEAGGVVLYVAGSGELIAYVYVGADRSRNDAFVVEWDEDGIFSY